MKFPSFKKTTTVKASEPKPSVVLPSAPNSLLPRLRKHLSFHSVALPDSVRIPANGTTRPDEVIRTLTNATIDDIAFAIQGTQNALLHSCICCTLSTPKYFRKCSVLFWRGVAAAGQCQLLRTSIAASSRLCSC